MANKRRGLWGGELAIPNQTRLDVNPAAVYLAGLAPSSRVVMREALDKIAGLL